VSPFCPVEGRYRFRFMKVDRSVDRGRGDSVRIHLACVDYGDNAGLLLHELVGPVQADLDLSVLTPSFPIVDELRRHRTDHIQALRLWLRRLPFFPKPAARTRSPGVKIDCAPHSGLRPQRSLAAMRHRHA
jgi:DUF1365 family protein